MAKFDALYARLPVFMQHLSVSAYGVYWQQLRFGGNYPIIEESYRQREYYSCEQWQDYQENQLSIVLCEAADQVPFYKDNWSGEQKRSAKEGNIRALPILSKEDVRQTPRSFVNPTFKPKRQMVFHTSGSTGTPIQTVWTVDELKQSMAVRETRSAGWAGVSFLFPRATFSGRMVEPDPYSNGPFYRFNVAEKQVYFSAFHLRPDTAKIYVDALKKHHVQWLTGYAVSFYLLAKFMLEKGITFQSLKAVITTSEKVTPEMKRVMETAYGCRIYEEYSCVENNLFASECEYGKLHVSPDVGFIEIIREDGSYCAPGEVGEVLATSLMKRYQPLIRYRVGDLAAWDPQPCQCGRGMPIIKEVLGRVEDVVVGPDGRQMVRFHGIFVDQPNIREGQIIQETLTRIRVKVVTTDHFSTYDVEDVIHRVQQRLGNTVNVIVEKVDFIPRTKTGKFKAVISLVNN